MHATGFTSAGCNAECWVCGVQQPFVWHQLQLAENVQPTLSVLPYTQLSHLACTCLTHKEASTNTFQILQSSAVCYSMSVPVGRGAVERAVCLTVEVPSAHRLWSAVRNATPLACHAKTTCRRVVCSNTVC